MPSTATARAGVVISTFKPKKDEFTVRRSSAVKAGSLAMTSPRRAALTCGSDASRIIFALAAGGEGRSDGVTSNAREASCTAAESWTHTHIGTKRVRLESFDIQVCTL